MKATMTIASRTAIASQVVFATLFIETSVRPALNYARCTGAGSDPGLTPTAAPVLVGSSTANAADDSSDGADDVAGKHPRGNRRQPWCGQRGRPDLDAAGTDCVADRIGVGRRVDEG